MSPVSPEQPPGQPDPAEGQQAGAEGQQDGPGAAESTDADHDAPTPNREAARYRTRLREVESERDGLVARVERHQHAEVDRLVGDRLAQPDDLTAFGLSLADLLGDDGEVDPALVDTALLGLLAARPGLAVATDKPKFPDLGGGKRGTSTEAVGSSWGQVIGQERNRG